MIIKLWLCSIRRQENVGLFLGLGSWDQVSPRDQCRAINRSSPPWPLALSPVPTHAACHEHDIMSWTDGISRSNNKSYQIITWSRISIINNSSMLQHDNNINNIILNQEMNLSSPVLKQVKHFTHFPFTFRKHFELWSNCTVDSKVWWLYPGLPWKETKYPNKNIKI